MAHFEQISFSSFNQSGSGSFSIRRICGHNGQYGLGWDFQKDRLLFPFSILSAVSKGKSDWHKEFRLNNNEIYFFSLNRVIDSQWLVLLKVDMGCPK